MNLTVRIQFCTVILAAAAAAGCGKGKEEPQAPVATSEAQVSRPSNQPAAVTGCLLAGEAADTFVLTTTAAEGQAPATYQLTAAPDSVNLKDHTGTRVEVRGVVEAQSQIVARESPTPAENATGTAGAPGTPTVQTGTGLTVQRMNVESIKPTGERCGEK